MNKYNVIWSIQAKGSLKQIHTFVKRRSPKGAVTTVNKIFDTAQKLEHLPNGHPIDTRLIDEPFVYRVIPIWNYQIVYTVDSDNKRVFIIQVFDTNKDPGKFKI